MPDIIDLSSRLITGMGAEQPLYEVPNSGMLVLQDVINATWAQANTKADALTTKITAMGAAIDALIATPGAMHVTAGSVTGATATEPTVSIPATAAAADIYADYETQYTELVTLLTTKFTDFRTTYFPDESAAYTAAEDWLQAALTNPNGGIPLTVQAQIIGDDHARISADANRASDALMATFAARRFPLPPGALASAQMQIQQKSQDLMAESSRKVTVLSVENMKFVVEKTLALRQSAMASAIAYIQALASGPEMASRLVGIGYDAQSKLISSASQFYNSRIAAAEMTNKVGQYNTGLALEAAGKNQALDLSLIEDKIKALLTETQAIAQMATSLFNNLHASVGLTANGGTAISTSGSF